MNRQSYIFAFLGILIFSCNLDSKRDKVRKNLCNNCPQGDTIWYPPSQTAIDNQSLDCIYPFPVQRFDLPKLPKTEAQELQEAFDSLETLYLQKDEHLLIAKKDSFQFQGTSYLFSHFCSCSTDTTQICIAGKSVILSDTTLRIDTIHTTYFLSRYERVDTLSSSHSIERIQKCLAENNFTKDNHKHLIELSEMPSLLKEAISISIPLKNAQLYINNQAIKIISHQYLEQHKFQHRSHPIFPFYYNSIVPEEKDTLCVVRMPLLSSIEKYHTHKHYYLTYRFF
ncbi:MAG: hypothetical protein GY810_18210 [Aureispira sp.]|nr:hypothetical protein [Aureispira sp.]